MQEEFVLLLGGRSTRGVMLRNGVVYRPHKTTSDFSNTILKFFVKENVSFTQRYMGMTEDGRDMYRYIEGYVPSEIGDTNLRQLCLFMRMIRKMHDSSIKITHSDLVICHNDLSPCNVVFQNCNPIAIIDWDSADIGERWEDLTYIVWLWINIGSHQRDKIDILGQMKTALSVYGADRDTMTNFADKLIWRMDKVLQEMPPDNKQFERTKDWVEYSKEWVKYNRINIAEEIG